MDFLYNLISGISGTGVVIIVLVFAIIQALLAIFNKGWLGNIARARTKPKPFIVKLIIVIVFFLLLDWSLGIL